MPAFLVHGVPDTHRLWATLRARLRRTDVIAPSLPGFGCTLPAGFAASKEAYVDWLAREIERVGAPVDLVGHDWGGQIAWYVASRHPARVRSLTVLSRPHPAAFRRAFKENADKQQHRSRHHKAFHDPNTAAMLLADDARRLRATLAHARVPEASIAEYLSVLGDPGALEAALAWYRAAGALANMEVGPVTVPTWYLWGDQDLSVGRSAAEWTADYVRAPYRFVAIPGSGHFLTDEVPGLVTQLLVGHIRTATH
jgi:pimeloyl-ACP methyl ester carboxylesterase